MGIQTDSFVKQSILLNKLNVSIFFILMTTFMMNSMEINGLGPFCNKRGNIDPSVLWDLDLIDHY